MRRVAKPVNMTQYIHVFKYLFRHGFLEVVEFNTLQFYTVLSVWTAWPPAQERSANLYKD